MCVVCVICVVCVDDDWSASRSSRTGLLGGVTIGSAGGRYDGLMSSWSSISSAS